MSRRLIVTLDGPAGSGKSTLARALARRLGVAFLDTGAMYRAVALAAVRRGLSPAEAPASLEALAAQLRIDFDWTADPPALLLDGERPGPALRTPDVSALASQVAALPGVRRAMVAAQQRIGRTHPQLVTEGRDQGSVVFPDATAKFWVVADPAERARRRVAQLREAGTHAGEQEVLAAILERDRQDAGRADSPMVRPEGAQDLDTTAMSEEAALGWLERRIAAATTSQQGSRP